MKSSTPPQLPDTLSAAILESGALLHGSAAVVEGRATYILKLTPGQPHALMLLVSARRLAGDIAGARDLLQELARAEPKLAAIHFELGTVLADMGDTEGAIAALRRVVELEPAHPRAWRDLGDLMAKSGKQDAAGEAYAKHIAASSSDLRVLDPGMRQEQHDLSAAERDLREWLIRHPTDVTALRMLAGIYTKLGRHEESEEQLSRAIDISPGFSVARWMLARSLTKRHQWEQALPHLRLLLTHAPEDEDYLNFLAECLVGVGKYEEAIVCFETLLAHYPTAENWMYCGHALRSVGRREDCIAAYRKAIAIKPEFGPAYWSLANLKTLRFEPHEIDQMGTALERGDLSRNSRTQMHFALGKAFEDEKQYAQSFEHYQKGNSVWRSEVPHESDHITEWVRRSKAVFTREFLRERASVGFPASDPIFIVGLMRSGTTLVEQILASHSMVDGAGELPILGYVAERIADFKQTLGENYPEILRERTADDFRAAGEEYIARTQVYRRRGRPFFTDKMMSNFLQLGLLLLILPNAKVIDARRHPLGAGFANFKQFYPEGQTFTFDLADIGRYYRDYVELMAHFDSVLPGRIHRIFYERMVTDTEEEVRKLLDFCGLPFEDSCLRFHETQRELMTASSEQVRRPIFAEGLAQWQNYERWLGPLKSALGDVLECYPDVPRFSQPAAPFSVQWGGMADTGTAFVPREIRPKVR